MPRKTLIETTDFPYHITNRSNNKEYFYISLPTLWEIMVDKIKFVDKEYGLKTHAFLLMSNHYHWILSTPRQQLSSGMTYFHREVAKKANKETRRINHFFGGRYKWSLIRDEGYYWNSLKYVFRNPVKANICTSVEEYEFSSLNQATQEFPWLMIDFFNDRHKKIELDTGWLNEAFLNEQEDGIRAGLRRRVFTLPKDKNRKRMVLDQVRYKKELGTA